MNRLTNSDLISASYSPWELCGLDKDCLRSCDDCNIVKMYKKLAAYEDIGLKPEELQEIVDKQKWHVVAEGDLPDEKGFYQCTVSDNYKNEVFIADVYNETTGFFHGNELYEVIAWRELPEPWEGRKEQNSL